MIAVAVAVTATPQGSDSSPPSSAVRYAPSKSSTAPGVSPMPLIPESPSSPYGLEEEEEEGGGPDSRRSRRAPAREAD